MESYAQGLLELYAISSRKLHEVIDLDGNICLLDVGGGAGHYSIMAARRNRKLKATVFDRPEIVEIAERAIRAYGLEDRVSTLPGDILRSRWPAGFNVILLSNVLHGKSDPETRALFSKASVALGRGGRLIVNEWIKGSNTFSNLFDLTLLLCTQEGRLRTREELSEVARKSGFSSRSWKRLDDVHWVMEAWKVEGRWFN